MSGSAEVSSKTKDRNRSNRLSISSAHNSMSAVASDAPPVMQGEHEAPNVRNATVSTFGHQLPPQIITRIISTKRTSNYGGGYLLGSQRQARVIGNEAPFSSFNVTLSRATLSAHTCEECDGWTEKSDRWMNLCIRISVMFRRSISVES